VLQKSFVLLRENHLYVCDKSHKSKRAMFLRRDTFSIYDDAHKCKKSCLSERKSYFCLPKCSKMQMILKRQHYKNIALRYRFSEK
jgi:hypothetical protein